MTTTPDPKAVREIARQAIRSLIAEQQTAKRYPARSHIELAMIEHGVDHADITVWPEVFGAVLAAVGCAQVTVSWPDEQPQDGDGEAREWLTYMADTIDNEEDTRICTAIHALLDQRAALAARVAELEAEQPQAEQEQLHDEYGIRITYISTRTLEATVADTLDGARAALADLNAEDRRDVVCRTLIQRVAGDWHDVEQQAEDGDRG